MDGKAFIIGIIVVALGVAGGVYLSTVLTRMTAPSGGQGY